MKRLLLIFILFSSIRVFSQSVPDFDAIPLDKGPDYKKAETTVIWATDYLLSTPFSTKDLTRLQSLQFLIKWMSGTPDYTFSIGKEISDISKNNTDLLGLYMACMTKYSLGNKDSAKDEKKVLLNSIKMLIDYCSNGDNKMKPTKPLKKLIEADKKGELAKALE